ncbi:MAG: AmmeMemoRadiSam system radical SAM enzyme [Chloroflexota bacterium]
MKEAMLFEPLPKGRVRCNLCSHRCVIPEGKLGVCRVRQNKEGKLYTLVYGNTISQHIDPVEKKPLYHFYPGSAAYSIATPGCNFKCAWCQNWEISQMPRERGLITGYRASPEQIVAEARASHSRSIAYTYTEPTVFFEYTYDIARLAAKAGIANVYVTNGYMTTEMLELLQPYLDAANVDLKAFRQTTYHRYVGAALQPILDNLKTMKRMGTWVEVTTLVVPRINDEQAEIRDAARFISQELGADTPWHISRFIPHYRMNDTPPTPLKTLQQARDIGHEEGLHYVYLGNVSGDCNTSCPQCERLLIHRQGYWIIGNHVVDGHCPTCGQSIAGVGLG